MRTRYAFLSVVALSISAFAQQPLPFPDSAAKWINTVWLVQPFPPPATHIFSSAQSYCADGVDTVINALTYTQLHYCGGAYKGAFRDDAGTVYYVPADSTSEFLLYDFTLQVGETAQNVYFETGGGAMLGNAL